MDWVAIKEFKLSYHDKETILCSMHMSYTHLSYCQNQVYQGTIYSGRSVPWSSVV